MQDTIDFLNLKREHIRRLANQKGAAGEAEALAMNPHFVPRPKGEGLKNLMVALAESGTSIRKSSFDAIALPAGTDAVDFLNRQALGRLLPQMVFIEIKTSNQSRVREDFSGFFFAFTEGEIAAAEALGARHRVMLLNRATGGMLLTSVPEIFARARSTNWQVSVQL